MISLDDAKRKIMNHKFAINRKIYTIFENNNEWIFVINDYDKDGEIMWLQPVVLMINKNTEEIKSLSFAHDEEFILSHKEIYQREIGYIEAKHLIDKLYKDYTIKEKYENKNNFLFIITNDLFKLTYTIVINKYTTATEEYNDFKLDYLDDYTKIK